MNAGQSIKDPEALNVRQSTGLNLRTVLIIHGKVDSEEV